MNSIANLEAVFYLLKSTHVSKTPVLHCSKLWTRISSSSTQCHSPSVVPLQIYLKQVVFPHWAAACCLKQGSASVCPLHNQTLKLGCNEGASSSSWIILHENNNYWNFLQFFFIFFFVGFWIEVRINTHPPPTTHSSCKLQILIVKLWIFPSLIEWDVKRFLKRLELFVVVTWIWITVCCFFDQISYLFSLSLPPHSFEHLSSFWGFMWQEQFCYISHLGNQILFA